MASEMAISANAVAVILRCMECLPRWWTYVLPARCVDGFGPSRNTGRRDPVLVSARRPPADTASNRALRAGAAPDFSFLTSGGNSLRVALRSPDAGRRIVPLIETRR